MPNFNKIIDHKFKQIFVLILILLFTSCTFIQPVKEKSNNQVELEQEAKKQSQQTNTESSSTSLTNKPKEQSTQKNPPKITETNLTKQPPKKSQTSDLSKQNMPKESTNSNIQKMEISEKSNGTMIRIITTTYFQEKNIAVSISSDNMVNITLYQGRFDENFAQKISSSSNVEAVNVYTFAESAQISIKLRNPILSRSIITKPNTVIISLFEGEQQL